MPLGSSTGQRHVVVEAGDACLQGLRVATRSGGRVVDGLVVVQLRSLDLQLLHLVENEDG